jgi:hypothetical protein
MERNKMDEVYFTGNPAHQASPTAYYGSGGVLIAVTDLSTALGALETIRHQGEGVHEEIQDGDPGLFGAGKDYAHFFRFNELLHGRFYDAGDKPGHPPSGPPLAVDWESIYPMRANPHSSAYPEGSELRQKSDGFNRAYTALLRSLHVALNGQPQKLQEAVAAMYDLRYKATALMRMPSGHGEETAGPGFEFSR